MKIYLQSITAMSKEDVDSSTPMTENLENNEQTKVLNQRNGHHIDRGWSWVVCFTAMICNGTINSIINTFGILYTFLLTEYARDDPDISFKTSFVGSVCIGLTFLISIVSSMLCGIIGIRLTAFIGSLIATIGLLSSAFIVKLELLYLTYGVLLGTGGGLVIPTTILILGQYFDKRFGLASGIVSFGSSLLSMVLSATLSYLSRAIQIKFTFIVLASMYFVCMIGILTWKPQTASMETLRSRHKGCFFTMKNYARMPVFKNKAYVIWLASCFTALFGYFGFFFHIVKHSNDAFPNDSGSFLITCTQITSAIGRNVYGYIADFRWANRILMHQAALIIMGIMFTCIPLSRSYSGLIAISLILGFSDGAFVCMNGPIAFDIVGKEHAAQAIGFLFGTFAIPFTVGPPFLGFLYDRMGNYSIAFYISGTPPIIGAIMMYLIPTARKVIPTKDFTEENSRMNVTVGLNSPELHDIFKSSDDENDVLMKNEALLKIKSTKH